MWTWDQSAGKMTSQDGATVFTGYSGADWGKNNPQAQAAVGIGPVPRGGWQINTPVTSANTGPYTMALVPDEGTDTEGRSAFRIHGDSIAHPGHASHGCIILPRAARETIWQSGDHALNVIT